MYVVPRRDRHTLKEGQTHTEEGQTHTHTAKDICFALTGKAKSVMMTFTYSSICNLFLSYTRNAEKFIRRFSIFWEIFFYIWDILQKDLLASYKYLSLVVFYLSTSVGFDMLWLTFLWIPTGLNKDFLSSFFACNLYDSTRTGKQHCCLNFFNLFQILFLGAIGVVWSSRTFAILGKNSSYK